MPLRLNDDQCLLWIKDPSISPFENNYVKRKYRKDILTEDTLKNPQSFLNKVKRKCFHNSALRQRIVEQIKEYQLNMIPRLHTLNDKLIDDVVDVEYTNPPFTIDECKKWVKWGSWQSDHLVNPRTNEEIKFGSNVYIELLYTSIQFGLQPPKYRFKNLYIPLRHNIIEELNDTNSKDILKIIKNIQFRLDFMKQNDEYFLNNDIASFDKKLKIESATSHKRKTTIAKPNNTFDVSSSSSSYKGFNTAERRLLRDMELENIEEKKSVAKYQYKKQFIKKGKKGKKEKPIFTEFRAFLIDLQDEILNGNQLINKILEDATDDARQRITVPINSYFKNKDYDASYLKSIIDRNKFDTLEGIISNFINNIYIQLIDPDIVLPPDMKIGCLTYINKTTHFKRAELIRNIAYELFVFIDNYSSVLDIETIRYFKNLVDDVIPPELVTKREIDVRVITTRSFTSTTDYQNYYYKLLLSVNEEPKRIRLPDGMGLLIGKELTNAIYELEEPYFNTYPEDRVITDDNPLNGFTYEECKDWVILPIINPRTFKPILIDSPMYNRLLCISYQYDTILIPRMITSRGYEILNALTEVIQDILKVKNELPQSRLRLQQYINQKENQYRKEKEKEKIIPNKIGLKWKNTGTKHPKEGIEIINEKITDAVLKSISSTSELPFYVLFSEEDLERFGITSIAKNSYIEIATYYIPIINRTSSSKVGLKWKRVGRRQLKEGEGIKKEGIEIINKKLKEALLKSKDGKDNSPSSIIFSEEDLVRFGITTAIAKNSYIKIANYYVPVYEKSFSDIIIKPKSNVVITKRNERHIVNKYYTVADCLRWARQPNRDPNNPNIIFLTDSKEYNAIFEQALLHDYNITPINITPKGIKFMNAILKISEKYLTIAKHLKLPISRGKNIEDINSKMCIAINNIFDDETKEEGKNYKKFKDKMIEKCEQGNKPPSICIEELKNRIGNYFKPTNIRNEQYKIIYYQDSALASLLIKYENIKGIIYKKEFRDIFIQNINAFYIYIYEIDDELNEYKKDAIDAGGPKREFFTKLFEELFCDDEHPTRPFISPKDIIGNKYYINPNFEPDANFRKVINAHKRNYTPNITDYTNERDYEYMYYVIGKLLCFSVYNKEIGLPQQFSTYILAGFIQRSKDIDYYDILYFYLKEFKNTISYINMINNTNIESVEGVNLSFNDIYIINKSKDLSSVNKGVEPPIPIKAQLPIDLLRYRMLSTTKDAVKNSSNERKLREYDEKWKKQLNEYEQEKEIYDRAGSKESDRAKITKKNCIKFLLQQSKHAVTKNCLGKEEVNSSKNMKKRYDSLFAGFSNEIRKFLYKNKVTIEQLNLLIINEPLTYAVLNELASKIVLKIEVSTVPETDPEYDLNAILSKEEKDEKEKEMKGYITNIITRRREGDTEKKHFEFIKKLLQFWTTLNYYNKEGKYRIFYKYGWRINVENLPEAHTCFNQLDIFGFPKNTVDKEYTPEMKEEFIYKKLLLAVGEQAMELH
jgi:hypothetical protein